MEICFAVPYDIVSLRKLLDAVVSCVLQLCTLQVRCQHWSKNSKKLAEKRFYSP